MKELEGLLIPYGRACLRILRQPKMANLVGRMSKTSAKLKCILAQPVAHYFPDSTEASLTISTMFMADMSIP